MRVKRSTVARPCDYCGAPFYPWLTSRYRADDGRFCGLSCSAKARPRPLLWSPERFWAKVDRNGPIPEHRPELGPCWVWTGSRMLSGYGTVLSPAGEKIGTHRRAWEIINGEIANRLHVLHHCDFPPCVRVDSDPAVSHLFLGTPKENALDKVEKGRARGGGSHGEKHYLSLITNAQATEMRKRYAGGGINQTDLGAEYGVTQTFVSDVIRRKTYREAK